MASCREGDSFSFQLHLFSLDFYFLYCPNQTVLCPFPLLFVCHGWWVGIFVLSMAAECAALLHFFVRLFPMGDRVVGGRAYRFQLLISFFFADYLISFGLTPLLVEAKGPDLPSWSLTAVGNSSKDLSAPNVDVLLRIKKKRLNKTARHMTQLCFDIIFIEAATLFLAAVFISIILE